MNLKLKIIITVGIIYCVVSCSTNKKYNKNTTVQKIDSAQMEGLKSYIKNTNYTGLLEFKSLSKINSNENEDIFLVENNVIETFKGNELREVNYEITVEKGDSIYFKEKTYIISLCFIDDKFYWAGTGSKFTNSQFFINFSRKISKKKSNQNTSFCE